MCLFFYPSKIKSTLSKSALKIEYPLCHAVALGKQSADAGKVGACIDARRGRLMGDEHCNAFSVPACGPCLEIPRDWRARKIQGMTARGEHRLDNIRI